MLYSVHASTSCKSTVGSLALSKRRGRIEVLRVPHFLDDLVPLVLPYPVERAVPEQAAPLAPVPALEVRWTVLALNNERRLDGERAEEAVVDEGGYSNVDRSRVGRPRVVEEGKEVGGAAGGDGPAVQAFWRGCLVEQRVEVLRFCQSRAGLT